MLPLHIFVGATYLCWWLDMVKNMQEQYCWGCVEKYASTWGVKFEDFVWGGVGIFWSDIMVLGEIDILVKYFGEIWWSIWVNYYGAIFDMFWWGIMVRYYGEIIWRDIMVSYYGEIFRWGIMVRYYGELRERGVLAAFPTNSMRWHPPIKVSASDQHRGDDDLLTNHLYFSIYASG